MLSLKLQLHVLLRRFLYKFVKDFIEREWRDNCSHKCNVTTTELAQDFTNSNMEHGHQKYAEESDETRFVKSEIILSGC